MTYTVCGMILIEAACAAVGIFIIREYNQSYTTLSAFSNSLAYISAEISVNLADIFQISEKISERNDATEDFFKKIVHLHPKLGEITFEEIWTSAIPALGNIPMECKMQIKKLGREIGKFTADEQVRALAECIDALNNKACEIKQAMIMKKKLTMCICLCLGTLIVIILI